MDKTKTAIQSLVQFFGRVLALLLPLCWIVLIPLQLLHIINWKWLTILLIFPIAAAGALTAVTFVLVLIGCVIYVLRGRDKWFK